MEVQDLLTIVTAVFTLLLSSILTYRLILERIKKGKRSAAKDFCIAFLHPNCNAGGGGERVLWMAIKSLQSSFPKSRILIYCAPYFGVSDDEIVKRAEKTFGLKMEGNIEFIRLWTAFLSEARCYPRLTLLLQAIGTFLMGVECVLRRLPDLLLDTQGCAFSYPFFWLASTPVAAYVHYPFVNLKQIESSSASFSPSPLGLIRASLDLFKRSYYRFIQGIYAQSCRCTTDLLVNSKWTLNHMASICAGRNCRIVYPPCDLKKMQEFDIVSERDPVIVSLSQFRPEKNHQMQLYVLKKLFERRPEFRGKVTLRLFGGCRDDSDRSRVAKLSKLARDLGIQDSVLLIKDATHDQILEVLSKSMIGIHTMQEEHFGIGIVEFMASGVIAVAHNSGGPKSDIILNDDEGYLCATVEEYANAIEKIISMPESSRKSIRHKARGSVAKKFDSKIFDKKITEVASKYSPKSR